MNDKIITVADVQAAATEAGEWVNGTFDAVVRNATAGQGRKPSKADLCDPKNENIKVGGAWFGGDFVSLAGAVCRFGGQGMKVKTFKGKVEVTIGDKSTVDMIDRAPEPRSHLPQTGKLAGGDHAPGDTEAHFHRVLRKTAGLWLHCFQYGMDIRQKLKEQKQIDLTDDQFQAAISSLFITAKDQGLLDRVPKLRAVDPVSYLPLPFTPKPATPMDPAAVAAEAARLAEEKRLKAEAEARRQREEDDQAPF